LARLKAKLPSAAALRALADEDGRLAVRVTPGARGESVEITHGRLLVKVRTKPEDGKATAAAIDLIAAALGVAPSTVEVLRGAALREKLLRIPLGN
jgi:uncharacterized protein